MILAGRAHLKKDTVLGHLDVNYMIDTTDSHPLTGLAEHRHEWICLIFNADGSIKNKHPLVGAQIIEQPVNRLQNII